MRLYHYWRSSASWRVRWALEFKQIKADTTHVHLLNGENESAQHRSRHPLGYVPALEIPGHGFLIESLAMLAYLEELKPTPSLYPKEPLQKAKTIELMEIVNSGIHPLQNIPTQERHSDDPTQRTLWAKHFIGQGLELLEERLPSSPQFAMGENLTGADFCIVPQLYNAIRFEFDLKNYPGLHRIWNAVQTEPTYLASHPDRFEPKT